MSTAHKLQDEWLLSYAAGALNPGRSLMVASHLAYHDDLQNTVADAEVIGGTLLNAMDEAGSNPCPPTIVGVGIGGTAEKAMFLAKKALLRTVGEPSPDPEVAELEKELLQRINASGIGPGGVGGRITSLAVHVETFPAHIASLPVAVNPQCHSARHKEAVL